MADAKLVFSLVDNADDVLTACTINKSILPIISLKTNHHQTIPDGVIDLVNLMDTKSININYKSFSYYKILYIFRC